MKEKEHDLTCQNCDIEYIVITEATDLPEQCPFCGALVEIDEDDED
jgi:rubrerythrin